MLSKTKIILFLLLFFSISYSQADRINFYSPDNIKIFADYLFCDRDYLRSVFEYEKYLSIKEDDSVKFKLGLSYKNLEEFTKSAEIFKSLFSKNVLSDPSKREYFNSLFQTGDLIDYRNTYSASTELITEPAKKLYLYSFFFTEDSLPAEEEYRIFNNDERINNFYRLKSKLPFKNEMTAALLSTVIPGAGKIYTEQYGDGITAFLTTGLLTFLSFNNFNAGHEFRGWLFGGLAAIFYAGNIYGSAASAQIYNAGIKFNFENDLDVYLNEHNYFMPEYNFCK